MEGVKEHWEEIYSKKEAKELSWYQEKPETSLILISDFKLKKDAAIIDVGGGDSSLADHLLAEGFNDITVVDISASALDRAKNRLGRKAEKIKWIEADAANFDPPVKYDLWHDRAVFHFLTAPKQISKYLETLQGAVNKGGYVILGTFSEKGPKKCSGIKIKQYSLHELSELLKDHFETIQCDNVDHITPGGAVQNFTFCTFKKL